MSDHVAASEVIEVDFRQRMAVSRQRQPSEGSFRYHEGLFSTDRLKLVFFEPFGLDTTEVASLLEDHSVSQRDWLRKDFALFTLPKQKRLVNLASICTILERSEQRSEVAMWLRRSQFEDLTALELLSTGDAQDYTDVYEAAHEFVRATVN